MRRNSHCDYVVCQRVPAAVIVRHELNDGTSRSSMVCRLAAVAAEQVNVHRAVCKRESCTRRKRARGALFVHSLFFFRSGILSPIHSGVFSGTVILAGTCAPLNEDNFIYCIIRFAGWLRLELIHANAAEVSTRPCTQQHVAARIAYSNPDYKQMSLIIPIIVVSVLFCILRVANITRRLLPTAPPPVLGTWLILQSHVNIDCTLMNNIYIVLGFRCFDWARYVPR